MKVREMHIVFEPERAVWPSSNRDLLFMSGEPLAKMFFITLEEGASETGKVTAGQDLKEVATELQEHSWLELQLVLDLIVEAS